MTSDAGAGTPSIHATTAPQHSHFDDLQAVLTGTLFVAIGLAFFRHTGLVTGGTVGLAFLLHYATSWSFGAMIFAINLPFYWLAWRRMSKRLSTRPLHGVLAKKKPAKPAF